LLFNENMSFLNATGQNYEILELNLILIVTLFS
jgi:hypothetical protein